jgi:hypothetical protein
MRLASPCKAGSHAFHGPTSLDFADLSFFAAPLAVALADFVMSRRASLADFNRLPCPPFRCTVAFISSPPDDEHLYDVSCNPQNLGQFQVTSRGPVRYGLFHRGKELAAPAAPIRAAKASIAPTATPGPPPVDDASRIAAEVAGGKEVVNRMTVAHAPWALG